MANKKLIIETEVKTDGLDKAAQKLGELKKLSGGVSIQYDINGKPLDVVIDKSLNLKKQVVELTKALRSVKEGSAEFRVLSSALGNAQDQLAASNAKSRDLLASLGLLPGPVGAFASQLNGVIGTLKLFSGFSFKDLKFQFKELNDDLNDIIQNIFGVEGAATKAKAELADTAATLANTGAETENTEATAKNVIAQKESRIAKLKDAEATVADTLAKKQSTLAFLELEIATRKELTAEFENTIATNANRDATLARIDAQNLELQKIQITALEKQRDSLATEVNTLEQVKNTAALEANTLQQEVNTIAQETNTGATTAANTAAKGFGATIRAITSSTLFWVAAIAAAGYGLYKLLTNVKEVDKDLQQANSKANESLETAKNVVTEVGTAFELAKTNVISKQKALEVYNEKLGNTIGKAETYNEAEKLFNDNTSAYIESVSLRAEAQELFSIAAQKAAKAVDPEEIKPTIWQDLGNALLAGGNGAIFIQKNLQSTLKNSIEFQTIANTLREKANELLKKALELENKFKPKDTKTNLDKKVLDTEKANDLLLKLEQENAVAILDTERKKQDKQLEIDRINEIAEVNKLKLSKDNENIRTEILLQIQEKYKLKVIALNRARQAEDTKIFEEDQKKLKDYQDNIFEILNSGDQNELNRAKAARTRKFEDDKAALQKDTNFQKENLMTKIAILLALEKAYRQDIQKLDDDDAANKRQEAIKKLDDELKFLQIRGEAVRKGTIEYFNNLRSISKKAEERELADLADRAIKEKLTTEQVEAEKTAIKKKYANERKQIDQQELDAYLQYAQQVLSAVSGIFSQIGQVNALEQQVAQENLTKSYIEANNQAKATITNQEELEKKLAENKKKFAKDEDSLKKAAFEQNKKIQIAQAVIATLQSAVQAFSSLAGIPVVGPALGAAAAAAALVFGYKQVALIKKTSYQSPLDLAESESLPNIPGAGRQPNYGRNYARGGMIGGRRHAEGGTIIEAEKGEAIMTRGAVAQFGPLLSLMNQAGGGTSFNSNLLTTRQDAPAVRVPAQQEQTPVFKTYVVSQELTTEAQRQARLKNLSVI